MEREASVLPVGHGRYYRRRVIRLVPGYYYALLVLYLVLLPIASFLPLEAR
jgi:peptidoglycan/LPS O-acetylase OafA/YrhL